MVYQIALYLGPIVACLIAAYVLFVAYQRKRASQGRALVPPCCAFDSKL